jgi:all-trans-8'-apo-beta-carotenal 15,15'-oxygenase
MTTTPISPAHLSTDSPSWTLSDWQKGYLSLKEEYDYWIDEIEGEIPPTLTGTLFRNGPGMLDVNGQRIQHPFDGDGMICAIAFRDGRAHFKNRYVRTEGFVAEQKAGKILYRGTFGTRKPGGLLANAFDLRLKNIANTQVIYWGKKLWALWEAAEPHQLDPTTLDTLGLDNLDGILTPGRAIAAHPRIDPACVVDGQPRLINFSVKPGPSTTITVYEFDATGQVVAQAERSVPGFAFIHDFVMTPNYYIFFQNPVSFNPLPYLFGFKAAAQCITLQHKQPTQVIIIPRHGQAGMQVLPVEAGFIFHHVNAFEQDGQIVVDSVSYPTFPQLEPDADFLKVKFDSYPPGQLWRYQIDVAETRITRTKLDTRSCEFPVVHPQLVGRPYRYAYLAATHSNQGNAPLQAIWKVDMQTGDRLLWSVAPRGFVGEPVFIPRPMQGEWREDDGWLVTLIFNAAKERSEVVILDAITMTPVARLGLKHHVPYGLHGTFTPEYFAPQVM